VGTLLPHLRQEAPNARIVGVDASAGMIALAPAGFEVMLADVVDLPLATGAFDVAVLAFMLFHVADPVAGLREIRRVLTPGGTMGLTTWAAGPSFPADVVWDEELEAHGAPTDSLPSSREVMDTPDKLGALVEAAGFRLVSLHIEPWRRPMTVDEVVALRTRLGMHGRRIAQLDASTRDACVGRVRQRLLKLDADALIDSDHVMYAIATASGE
jgi:SAM-dependent methyltransferase